MTVAVAAILLSLTTADLDRVEWLATDARGNTQKITASITGDVFDGDLPKIAIDRNARWVLDPGCNQWRALVVSNPGLDSHQRRFFGMPSQPYTPRLATPIVYASSQPRTVQEPINRTPGEPLPDPDPPWNPIGAIMLALMFIAVLVMIVMGSAAEAKRSKKRNAESQADIDTTEDSAVHRELVEIGRQHNTDREEVGPWR